MPDYSAVISDLEEKRTAIDTTIRLLRDLYGPAPVPAPLGKPHRTKHTGSIHKVAAPENTSGEGRPSPTQDAVLKVLTKLPVTSIEVYEAVRKGGTDTTSGSVYITLRTLLAKGVIEKTENEEGRVAWKVA